MDTTQASERYVFCWRHAHRMIIVAFALMLTLISSRAAQAALEYYATVEDSKGTKYDIYIDNDKGVTAFFGDNGEVFIFYDDGNPNPVDGTTAPGDYDSMEDLLKQQGGTGYLQTSWEDTFLGGYLSDYGAGPYHNPADGDDSGGLSPHGGTAFKTPEELAEEAFAGGGVDSTTRFDGNGGSVGGQLEDAIRTGGRGDDGNSDDDVKPSVGGFWGEDMPGPPELVNPSPEWTEADELYFQLMLLEMDF